MLQHSKAKEGRRLCWNSTITLHSNLGPDRGVLENLLIRGNHISIIVNGFVTMNTGNGVHENNDMAYALFTFS